MDRQSGPVQMESNPPSTQGLQHVPTEPLAWAETAGRVIHYLMIDFAGGRRWLKLAWVINFQKLTGKSVGLCAASLSREETDESQ